MANTEIKTVFAALVKSGMYDTSRTAHGIPYFVQNGQRETVPNPALVRTSRVRADEYFVESPDGHFPNGPIWRISIPAGLSTTKYPDGTLFPNPARQNFSTKASLGATVRRFFDAEVSLIESGKYKYGPNNTLAPTSEQEQRFKRFEAMVNDSATQTWYWVESGVEKELVDRTPERRQRLIRAMEAVTSIAIVKGIRVPDDPDGIGWREACVEDIDLLTIVREFGLSEEKLPEFKKHVLQVEAVHSLQNRNGRREHSKRVANGGIGWQKGY